MSLNIDTKTAAESKRIRRLRLTYRLFLVTLALCLLVTLSAIYLHVTGLSTTAHLHSEPFYMVVGLFVVIGVSIIIASAGSGWMWARFAKRFLDVTAEEMRTVVTSESISSDHLDLKTEKAIKKPYKNR